MFPSLTLHLRCRIHGPPAWPLSVVLLLSLAAVSAAALPFEDALRLAEHAPTLQAHRSLVAAGREEAARAAALPDPRLMLGVANLPVTGADGFDFGADMMTMKQIGLMQEFSAGAKRRARRGAADRAVELALARTAAEALRVRQAVAGAWIGLWAAQRQLAALQDLREPTEMAIRIARARLAAGTGTVTDTLAVQATAPELEIRLDAAASAVLVARAGLVRWLGTDVQPGVRAEGPPPLLTSLPVTPARLLAALDSHWPLLPWQSQAALAEAGVQVARAEGRPDWSLGVTYGQRDDEPGGTSRSDMVMVEFSVALPLFTRNRQDRGVAARRAELEAIIAEREDARRAQAGNVQSVLAEWEGLKRQVARLEGESLPLARDRGRTALAAYAAGGDLQPWLDARRDEIQLRIEHARYLAELGRAWAALAYLVTDGESAP